MIINYCKLATLYHPVNAKAQRQPESKPLLEIVLLQ